MSISAYENNSVELKVVTATWSLWAPHTSESTAKKEVTVMLGVIATEY